MIDRRSTQLVVPLFMLRLARRLVPFRLAVLVEGGVRGGRVNGRGLSPPLLLALRFRSLLLLAAGLPLLGLRRAPLGLILRLLLSPRLGRPLRVVGPVRFVLPRLLPLRLLEPGLIARLLLALGLGQSLLIPLRLQPLRCQPLLLALLLALAPRQLLLRAPLVLMMKLGRALVFPAIPREPVPVPLSLLPDLTIRNSVRDHDGARGGSGRHGHNHRTGRRRHVDDRRDRVTVVRMVGA